MGFVKCFQMLAMVMIISLINGTQFLHTNKTEISGIDIASVI